MPCSRGGDLAKVMRACCMISNSTAIAASCLHVEWFVIGMIQKHLDSGFNADTDVDDRRVLVQAMGIRARDL